MEKGLSGSHLFNFHQTFFCEWRGYPNYEVLYRKPTCSPQSLRVPQPQLRGLGLWLDLSCHPLSSCIERTGHPGPPGLRSSWCGNRKGAGYEVAPSTRISWTPVNTGRELKYVNSFYWHKINQYVYSPVVIFPLMIFGSFLVMSAIAAKGIPQLAMGPQKWVLHKITIVEQVS